METTNMSLFWWVVAGTIASFLGIATAIWWADRLYWKAHWDAEYRFYLLIELIQQLSTGPEQDSEEDELSPEESVQKNKEFWTAVADVLIARLKEKDGKTAGGLISQKSDEARGLLSLLSRAKEDPKGVFEDVVGRRNW